MVNTFKDIGLKRYDEKLNSGVTILTVHENPATLTGKAGGNCYPSSTCFL
jgi:hypothetical protein